MKMIDDVIIIGIDSGYGNIKTANCCFPASVSTYAKEPVFKENLLVFESKFYLIGEGHKEFLADKTKDLDYYVLALAAIARELNIRKMTCGKIRIAAGLPLTWVSGQRDEFRDYLLQNKAVDFSFRNVSYHVEIVGVDVFPQGFAAVADRLSDFRGVNMICDIGNGTMNIMFINDKKTKFPKFWRTLFMVTIAVPQFVTLLLVRNFFSNNGIFNTMMANAGVTDFLHNIGLLDKGLSYIPFLTQPGWAMFTIIMINIWIGVPYQMLIATGVLMNIPADMIEAARIDGANPVQMFFRIKLPYLLSVQGPSLVTDFVKNVNNFNVIYLLTQDVFVTQNQALAQSNAKEIDLLVTWLFRLTQDYYNYKMAAVLGIMVFIVCAVFTVVCFHFINKKEAMFS